MKIKRTPKDTPAKGLRLSKARLDELIEAALVDAYGESEQVAGFYTMMENDLRLPFETQVLGVTVSVESIDITEDDQLVAVCRNGKARQRISLSDRGVGRANYCPGAAAGVRDGAGTTGSRPGRSVLRSHHGIQRPEGLRYEAGFRIGELSLGEGLDGVVPWGWIDNRPFLRCMNGFGLCLWRLGRFGEAGRIFDRMLWLNPSDNQGVRFLIDDVRAKVTWENSRVQ
jgi:hypothetical protein